MGTRAAVHSFSLGSKVTPTKAYFQINQSGFSINVSVVKTCFLYIEKYLILCPELGANFLAYIILVYFKVFPFKSENFKVLIE